MVQNLIYTFALDCSFVYYKDTAKGSLSSQMEHLPLLISLITYPLFPQNICKRPVEENICVEKLTTI